MKKLKASTLIEAVVYLALFGAVFLMVMQFAFAIGGSNDKTNSNNEIQRNMIFLNEHFTGTFSVSESIDDTNSLFNIPDGILRFNTASGYLEYKLVQGNLVIEDGTSSIVLTDPKFSVNSFLVEPVLGNDASVVGSKITMEIYSSNTRTTRTLHSSYLLD